MRRLLLFALLGLLVAGCGARSSRTFTAKGTAGCLKDKHFTQVTTDPAKVGFIAGFAANGGIKATSPNGNVVTIAFTEDSNSVASTEKAFRLHAPLSLRSHMQDVMSTNQNAVIVWTVGASSDDASAVTGCLSP